jgi:phosphoglycerate dehydrogenase-like enzyme
VQASPVRGSGQHRDLVAEVNVEPLDVAPETGGITLLPRANPLFTDAVESAGGSIVPLGPDTRAIMWLSYAAPERLATVLDENPQVGWVQLPWAGVDVFADVLANHPEPLWTSAKGAYSEPVAEQALGLTIALLRQYPQRALSTSWATEQTGTSLYGLNVVIVGAGGIALELIRLLSVFEARITVVRRSSGQLGAVRTVTSERLLEVLPDADVVVIAAASTAGTAKFIGAPELDAMKPSAVLVNIARGALVDTDALVDALRSGSIAGAGLDVTDPEPLPDGHPLWNEPACLITSHSADTPPMTAPLLASRIATNVRAYLGDGRFVGIVDPEAGY